MEQSKENHRPGRGPAEGGGISSSLKKLDEIVGWFDTQEEVDVEEGLKRVKEGVALLGELKARLKKVENEFEEVKKELATEEE